MTFLVSPAVQISERDFTNIVPAVATTPGAFAGSFQWGPVLERVLIASENELVQRFGKPNDATAESFFSAANFLAYGAALNVVRNVGTSAANASSIGADVFNGDGTDVTFTLSWTPNSVDNIEVRVGGVVTTVTLVGDVITFSAAPANGTGNIVVNEKQLIKNEDEFLTLTGLPSSVYAKYPGTIGNSLKVILADSATFSTLSVSDKAIFTAEPDSDEVHFAVIDEDGSFTGTAGTVLEIKEFLSTTPGAKFADGSIAYYKDYINSSSAYVWSTGTLTDLSTGSVSLVFGASDDTLTDGEVQDGYALFANDEEVDISLVVLGAVSAATASYVIDNVTEVRKDCIAFISPEKADVINNTGNELTDVLDFRDDLPSTSYAVLDCGWKYQYDRYNDVARWIPLNGDIAGLCARVDFNNDPWFSPAGVEKGQIKNVIKLAWSPNRAQRDELYKKAINPVIRSSGQGTYLFGDKTLLAKPSAFDRINVRRLFIVMEKAIATAAKFMLFEFNDEFTRARYRNLVEPYLRDIQGRRGLTRFRVICDTSNNTAQVIASNGFVADHYIQPNYSINFIYLNFNAVNGNVQFLEQEISGL